MLTATSFARALQRSYELAWRLPPAGLRAAWRPLALVIGLALYVELLFLFSRLVRGVPAGTLLEDLAAFAGAWAVWTGAGWILLAGRVRLRLLAAGGLLTAVGFAILRRLAAVYLPNLVATNQQQFGCSGWRLRCSAGCRRAHSCSWWPRSSAPWRPRTLVGSVRSSVPRMSAPHPLRVMPIAALGEIPISNLATWSWNRPSTAT